MNEKHTSWFRGQRGNGVALSVGLFSRDLLRCKGGVLAAFADVDALAVLKIVLGRVEVDDDPVLRGLLDLARRLRWMGHLGQRLQIAQVIVHQRVNEENGTQVVYEVVSLNDFRLMLTMLKVNCRVCNIILFFNL